jgi:thiol:disulfide interchange protein DsbD
VLGLAAVIFLLALSLFDVFPLPMLGLHLKSDESGTGDAFVSGVLVTLLATPCSGPLLGGVLGWAVMQPPAVRAALFMAVGVGMALPYLLLALFPKASRFVPRAGAWTGIIAKVAGMLLVGTSLYLISVLPGAQWGAAVMTLMAVLLFAFAVRRWAGLSASAIRRRMVWAVGIVAITACIGAASGIRPSFDDRTAFDVQAFRQVLGKENLLVEFTADWCPSCKVLERTSLSRGDLIPLEARYGTKVIVIDLTRPDAEADALLRSLGSISIPLVALFPKGEGASSPVVLRDLFTTAQLRRAAELAWKD